MQLLSKSNFFIFILLVLAAPSFWRMIQPGIFSMHDFHLFRLFEFDRCVRDLQIPCRWAPDASLGYGQPLFNFYSQIVYVPGEILHLLGFQIIDSVKFLFILSIVGSAVAMFFLAKQLWSSVFAGFLSSTLYVYAPYRAVDVWVRGALPEASAFMLFPLIIFFFNRYVLLQKFRELLIFSGLLSLLILVHNLSFFMFLFFLVPWGIYFLTINKRWFLVKNFILVPLVSFGLSAFYLLPVLAETKLITLSETTTGYYNFGIHFTSLEQLFVSRVWGYGASQWGVVDDLSLSAGHIHWILSLLVLMFVAWRYIKTRRLDSLLLSICFIVFVGWFALFLTHGKSVGIWEFFKPLSYIQFPWRFLSLSTFAFSLAAGAIFLFLNKNKLRFVVLVVVITAAIGLNVSFFKEDIWFNTSDSEQFSGNIWQWHTSSAMNDFWPKYAIKIPANTAPVLPVFLEGSGEILEFTETSKSMSGRLVASSNEAIIQFPSVYFDGWKGFVNGESVQISSEGNYGQMTVKVGSGEQNVGLKFTNTPVRTAGNIISLASLGIFGLLLLKRK